jgi:exodeoxyribonuclease VII large subunit
MNEPRINIPEWTVSELSAALKRTVEDAYGHVRVRGEISGYRGPHSSGHAYFALKDEGAKIDAVVWSRQFARMRIKPEEGLEVVATGRLTTYPGRSSYQIVIETLEPAGLGALMALLEQRKQKFAAEGLFDEARKQLLPFLPAVIGVVTSPTGAVIRDILHRLSDRFPRHVLVWPVRVQGDGAAEEIAAAIRGFNEFGDGRAPALPRPDLIIAARGGGSIEDLWAFNEEIVVRAAAESLIPLISAVGHETDFTLIDFVADRRAPTPTAAAEMAVPVRIELIGRIDSLAHRSLSCWARAHDHRRTELRAAIRALPSAEMLLALPRQRLDVAGDRLPRALIANAQAHHAAFSRVASRLNPHTLRTPILRNRERVAGLAGRVGQCMRVHTERRHDRFDAVAARLSAALRANAEAQGVRIARGRERIDALGVRAARATAIMIDRRQARLERAGQLLAALSYHGVLARGFALVRADGGAPLRTAAAVGAGMRLDIEFADGHVGATADGGDRMSADPAAADRATAAPATADQTGADRGAGSSAASRSRPLTASGRAAEPARPKLRRGDNPGQGSLF